MNKSERISIKESLEEVCSNFSKYLESSEKSIDVATIVPILIYSLNAKNLQENIICYNFSVMQNGDNSREILKADSEILLPKNTARALGRGLNVIFAEREEEIEKEMNSMKTDPLVDKARVKIIRESIDRINDVILKMQKSKEVKIVKAKNEFKFSQDAEEQQVPRNEEITLSPELTNQMILCMRHTFFNPLTPINGNLELIETRSKAEETRNRSSSKLLEIFNGITSTLQGIAKADQWKLVTDQSGETTIIPIHFANT